ncbi:MAG: hypothetical protein BWX87_00661 [Bacteroidetes bacterium ADurb.Bin123]|jgi:hypothetical protein|nr:MAG: hypothetical protein BWX87_00661 [Bacteroidetes bacterium ADurb.Bin123]
MELTLTEVMDKKILKLLKQKKVQSQQWLV